MSLKQTNPNFYAQFQALQSQVTSLGRSVNQLSNGGVGSLSTAALPIVWGVFGGGSGSVVTAGSANWTIARSSAGVYVVTFDTDLTAVPSVTCLPYYAGSGGVIVVLTAYSTAGFTVKVWSPAGAAQDSDVSFVAVG